MTGSFAVVILWAIYGAGSTATLAVLQPTEHWWILMFANVILPSQAVLLALLYYSWKSRHIFKAFSDWIDNLLAASNTIMLPTIDLILRITVFDSGAPSRTNPPSIETILVNTFLIFGDVSLCVVQLFGKLAFIQFSNIKIATDLDPRHLFGMAWRKHSVRVGKTAASRPAPSEVPQAFNVVGGSAMNTYGPSAVSSKSFECKKQQAETAASTVLGVG
ncbi:hypothetical protein SARC_00980 [Sphaeroforma arctica JP610]|uniref:Uncharacterized protein n=1 Tax=Sphaeroforma arctica JP610 TaxID=667725 RepID=A0A0L0GCZ2_9EUKA|nr:hypothetical protein SARC_00980 [Sphaeroforma arctica JP610]KNC86885.1 hypothetical protein SARC_00980 [Sphaeroforma arctica JP610]|eukprot:XP_014160787.1 hypothetical protein SARC_00980 [Sphaeroforma arctica JP610]